MIINRSKGPGWFAVGVGLALWSAPGIAASVETGDTLFRWFPGASRAISHAYSASRDTALLAYEATPYTILHAGGDVGLAEIQSGGFSLRPGFFGFVELESSRPLESEDLKGFVVLPSAGVHFWRGVNGFSLAAASEEIGERWFGEGGRFELTLSVRHESEHFSGSTEGSGPQYRDVPHIGNFLMPDVAIRAPFGPLDMDFRLQNKFFQITEHNYTFGPGFDWVVRWNTIPGLRPFASTFGEYVWGGRMVQDTAKEPEGDVPDAYLFRQLIGVLLPGPAGEIQVFTAFSIGHGKGLQVYRKEFLWGGGIRLAFF